MQCPYPTTTTTSTTPLLSVSWPLHHPDPGAGHMESIRLGQRSWVLEILVMDPFFFYVWLWNQFISHICVMQPFWMHVAEWWHPGGNFICFCWVWVMVLMSGILDLSLIPSVSPSHSLPIVLSLSLCLFSIAWLAGLPSCGQRRNCMVLSALLLWHVHYVRGMQTSFCMLQ